MDRRRSRRLILAAAAVALILRLAFGLFYWTGKPLTHDEREYLALADSLSHGRGFTYTEQETTGVGRRFGRAPGYPAFLALLRVDATAHSVPTAVKIAQSLLGVLAVLLIAAITSRAAGDRAGVIAAWIAAVYPSLVTMPAYIFSETLYLPLALLCTHLLTITASHAPFEGKAAAGPARLYRSLAAGIVAGIATLVRGGMLVFVPIAAVWLARRRELALAIAFALAATLTIAPWTLRNLRHHGRLIVIAADGGVTFWTGNHPLARGEGDLAANPELKRAEVAFRAAHPGLTAEQLEPLYYRDALRYIRDNPGWWLTLIARKAFYTIVPIGPSYTLHSPKYLFATVVPYALLAPLAIAGFVVISRYGRPPEPLYLLGASVMLTSLIFFPQERFRLPVIDPLVIVGAAAAIGGGNRQRP